MLESAAEWFLEHAEVRDGGIDASEDLWIFSGSRSSREFLRRIREAATARRLALVPPLVSTPGRFDVHAAGVLAVEQTTASEIDRLAAWADAVLDAANRDAMGPLLDRDRATPRSAWALAGRLMAAADELRGEGISPEMFADGVGSEDRERWRVVAEVEGDVRRRLASAGLLEPSEWRETVIAAASGCEGRRVIAVGVLEWSGWQRRLLSALGASVLVAAPRDLADAFDACGAVVPEAWIGRPLDLDDESVKTAATVHEATELVLDEVDRRADGERVSSVTIGVADDALLPSMLRAAHAAELAIHAAPIEPLTASAPGRAVEALRNLVEQDSAEVVAALLRHPHLAQWLGGSDATGLASTCTALLAEALPRDLAGLAAACDRTPRQGRRRDRDRVADDRQVLKQVVERMASRRGIWASEPRLVVEWALELASWLAEVHEAIDIEDDDREILRDDLAAVAEVIREFARLPEALDSPVSGLVFLERVLDRIAAGRRGDPPTRGDEVEAVGWLELAADPAPHLIVLGLHDAAIPGGVGADPLLAESARERLGLPSQRRRLARDAAILAGLAARTASLRIVIPQRAADGTPLLPSRLLLGGEGESLARRVLALTGGETGGETASVPPEVEAPSSGFAPPLPDPTVPLPDRLSITAIRTYLADPYRFHLKHVERLEEATEGGRELDARAFGTFAHAVVEAAARSEDWKQATTAEDLGGVLEASLDATAESWFGGACSVGFRLQMRSLRRRFDQLAVREAASRAAGWRTESVEARIDAALELGPGEAPQAFTGRIDRIDRNLETGRLRILDYKTGDRATDPAKAHRVGRAPNHRWIDLQLPLYRHLHAVQHGLDEREIDVGYVTLATGARGVDFRMLSNWDEGDHSGAIDKAREVVRSIRARKFESPGPGRYPDEFSNLCGEPVLAEGGAAGDGGDA